MPDALKLNMKEFIKQFQAEKVVVTTHCSKCNTKKHLTSNRMVDYPKFLIVIFYRNNDLTNTKLHTEFDFEIKNMNLDELNRCHKKANETRFKVDPKRLKKMIDMGFNREKASYALNKCNNSLEQALKMFLENPDFVVKRKYNIYI